MRSRSASGPRASVLALLFLLATVAAPVVDAWLHTGDDAAAAAQHSGASDCVICRLATTASAPAPAGATTFIEPVSAERGRFVPVEALVHAAPARLTPPTRAPPA